MRSLNGTLKICIAHDGLCKVLFPFALPFPHWSHCQAGTGPSVANADDFIAGYFDKYVSDDSARFLESMKWQRRFFVFSENQRVLYYFKGPEDVSKPTGLRGQVNIAGKSPTTNQPKLERHMFFSCTVVLAAAIARAVTGS